MTLKTGKFYKHSSGRMIYIFDLIQTDLWSSYFVTESGESCMKPMSISQEDLKNWKELTLEEWELLTGG